MPVRIRLARFGRKVMSFYLLIQSYKTPNLLGTPGYIFMTMSLWLQNLPFYRIFVADSRAPRDGKHIEAVGHYNPVPG